MSRYFWDFRFRGFLQNSVPVNNVLEFGEEPGINFCEVVEFLDGVASPDGSGQHEHPFVGWVLQLIIIHFLKNQIK